MEVRFQLLPSSNPLRAAWIGTEDAHMDHSHPHSQSRGVGTARV